MCTKPLPEFLGRTGVPACPVWVSRPNDSRTHLSEVLSSFILSGILISLCSCAVGPDYKKPDVTNVVPSQWHWKIVEPNDANPKGDWWKIFNDPPLDVLETL